MTKENALSQLILDVAALKADMAWIKKLVFLAATGSIGTIVTVLSSPYVHAWLRTTK